MSRLGRSDDGVWAEPPLCHRPGLAVANLSTAGQRRRSQRRLALNIARRRLVSGSTTADGGAPLLFRRGDDTDDVSSPVFPFLNAAFLNDEVVLASDSTCRIDAVRLGRYDHPDAGDEKEEGGDANDRQDDDSTDAEMRRHRGRLVASRVGELVAGGANQASFVRLKGLRNGQAFVAGMSSGEMRVFATEHEKTWKRGGQDGRDCGSSSRISRGSRCRGGRGSDGPLGEDAPFLEMVLRKGGPRRRYHREPDFSLQRILKIGSDVLSLRYLWREIPAWNDGYFPPQRSLASATPVSRLPRRHYIDDALWDFCETPSALLAVHIDQEKDCFSLRVTDERMQRLGRSDEGGLRRDTTPGICVDLSSTDKCAEDIQAVCFSGDHCIVTAHVQAVKTIGTSNSCSYRNILKWWDRRMLRRESASPCVSSRLVSFPLDDVVGLSPSHTSTIMCQGSNCVNSMPTCSGVLLSDDGHWIQGTLRSSRTGIANLSQTSCLSITRLTTHDHPGTLAISMSSDTTGSSPFEVCEEVLIDSAFQEVLQTTRFHIPASDVCFIGASAHLPAVAYNSSLDFMACYGTLPKDIVQNSTSTSSILLYDISRKSGCENINSAVCSGLSAEPPTRKRRRESSMPAVRDNHDCVGVLPAQFADKFGLQSTMSCMAFNESGTSLVCGTRDGDLFIWRGA